MIYIGIDPDVHKSGYAKIDTQTNEFDYGAYDFFDLIDKLNWHNKNIDNKEFCVIIEAGWLNKKSNFHFAFSKFAGERIAKNVGANHQIGKLFELYCNKNKINYLALRPTTAKWNKAYCKSLTGYDIKNQDIIDAIKLIWGRK